MEKIWPGRLVCAVLIVCVVFLSGCQQDQLQKPEASFQSTQAIQPIETQLQKDQTQKNIADGDTVLLQYVVRLADGKIVSRTEDGKAMKLTIGERSIIPGLDQAIKGMYVQETKDFRINAANAYGTHNPQLLRVFDRASLPEAVDPVPGLILRLSDKDGRQMAATVIKVEKTNITVDLNHPLAGKDLFISVRIVDIV